MHIIHLIIIFLLLLIVFAVLSSWRPNPGILYLIPLIIHIAIVEICFLCGRQPPGKLVDGWESLHGLRGRSFAYQFAAALSLGGGWSTADTYAGFVWFAGVMLFVLAILANDYGFSDWVDVSRPKRGEVPALVNLDEESEARRAEISGVEGSGQPGERRDEPRIEDRSEFGGTDGSLV
jgi:hypothetical protein